MVNAYYLESKIAVYPRIVVDDVVLKAGINNPGVANTKSDELEYLEKLLMYDKKYQLFYLDFLSQYTEFDDGYIYDDYIKRVRDYIISNLATQTNERIISKFKWFKKYYNKSIKKVYNEYSALEI